MKPSPSHPSPNELVDAPDVEEDEAARLRKQRRRRGSVIVIALTILTPVMIAGGSVLSATNSYSREVELGMEKLTARVIASTGAHEVLATLDDEACQECSFDVESNGGLAVVGLTDLSSDGIDSDGNGMVDDSAESGLVAVRSEAWLSRNASPSASKEEGGWMRSVVEANLRQVEGGPFSVDQSIYLHNPFATIDLQDASFLIVGSDYSGGEGVSPLGVAGDPLAIDSQLTAEQRSRLQKDSENDAVKSVQSQDLPGLAHSFGENATATVTTDKLNGDEFQQLVGSQSGGTSAILHATGDLTLNGAGTMRGVLVVEGDLVIEGTWDFEGVVIVLGKVQLGKPKASADIDDPFDPFGGIDSSTNVVLEPSYDDDERESWPSSDDETLTKDHFSLRGGLFVGGAGDPGNADLSLGGNVHVAFDSAAVEQHAVTGPYTELLTWSQDGEEATTP